MGQARHMALACHGTSEKIENFSDKFFWHGSKSIFHVEKFSANFLSRNAPVSINITFRKIEK